MKKIPRCRLIEWGITTVRYSLVSSCTVCTHNMIANMWWFFSSDCGCYVIIHFVVKMNCDLMMIHISAVKDFCTNLLNVIKRPFNFSWSISRPEIKLDHVKDDTWSRKAVQRALFNIPFNPSTTLSTIISIAIRVWSEIVNNIWDIWKVKNSIQLMVDSRCRS